MLLDKGSLARPADAELENTSKRLLTYFFIGLTLPNDKFWVNLRPDSPDNIIDPVLEQTDIGKVLLESDLELKKDTARATSPETPEGKEYWDKLYAKAAELFSSENVTIPTLTRPWIVPDEIIIRESPGQGEVQPSAYIYKATLKVCLEQDYLKDDAVYNFKDERQKQLNEYSSQLIRESILPKLTKAVNTSKKYAALRQVYYSLILAQWFKARNLGKDNPYAAMIDRQDLSGITPQEAYSKDTYFKAYQQSFKDGEYNIQSPVSTPFGQSIRSYFSGGAQISLSIPDFGQPTTEHRLGHVICEPANGKPRITPSVLTEMEVAADNVRVYTEAEFMAAQLEHFLQGSKQTGILSPEQVTRLSQLMAEAKASGRPVLSEELTALGIPAQISASAINDIISLSDGGVPVGGNNTAEQVGGDQDYGQSIWYNHKPNTNSYDVDEYGGRGNFKTLVIRYPSQYRFLRGHLMRTLSSGKKTLTIYSVGAGDGREPASIAAYLEWLQDESAEGRTEKDKQLGKALRNIEKINIIAVDSSSVGPTFKRLSTLFDGTSNEMIEQNRFEEPQAVEIVNKYLSKARSDPRFQVRVLDVDLNSQLDDLSGSQSFEQADIVFFNEVIRYLNERTIKKLAGLLTSNVRREKLLLLSLDDGATLLYQIRLHRIPNQNQLKELYENMRLDNGFVLIPHGYLEPFYSVAIEINNPLDMPVEPGGGDKTTGPPQSASEVASLERTAERLRNHLGGEGKSDIDYAAQFWRQIIPDTPTVGQHRIRTIVMPEYCQMNLPVGMGTVLLQKGYTLPSMPDLTMVPAETLYMGMPYELPFLIDDGFAVFILHPGEPYYNAAGILNALNAQLPPDFGASAAQAADDSPTGGTMGRWGYENTTLSGDGTLTLHNATRIPRKDGVVEDEFLIAGQNKPRDIVLQTRVLRDDEQTKVSSICQDLKMGEVTPRVIVRDESAIRHRIYGIAAQGIPFIREDIIAEGNRDQIKEALDHENRELTEATHDDIRRDQYQGNLRALITQLSERDKKEALSSSDDSVMVDGKAVKLDRSGGIGVPIRRILNDLNLNPRNVEVKIQTDREVVSVSPTGIDLEVDLDGCKIVIMRKSEQTKRGIPVGDETDREIIEAINSDRAHPDGDLFPVEFFRKAAQRQETIGYAWEYFLENSYAYALKYQRGIIYWLFYRSPYFTPFLDQTKIIDLPKSPGMSDITIASEQDVIKIYDPPIIDAGMMLYRCGIETSQSSANSVNYHVDKGIGWAYITINANSLSAHNRENVVRYQKRIGTTEPYLEINKEREPVVIIHIPFTKETTIGQLNEEAERFVRKVFSPQKKGPDSSIGWTPDDLFKLGKSLPSSTAAATKETKNTGGIDFRSLPIVTQAMTNLSVSHANLENLASMNLSEEWQDIERLVTAGITPSAERIRGYLQSSCAKGEVDRDVDKVVSCISQILRIEEESCCQTEAMLRDILVVLEAARSGEELKQVFLGKVT